MELVFRKRYEELTDKEIVNCIISVPHDEEAATYLLHVRYSPKLHKICIDVFNSLEWYEDCLGDFFIYMKGVNGEWDKFRLFQWRCNFSTWIGKIARNRFIAIKPYLIGKIEKTLSIDDDQDGKPQISLPDDGESYHERNQLKVLLVEAIGELKDADQKFVIIKTIEGYNGQEIAMLLEKKWIKEGVKKIDNKGNKVTPSAGYVNVHRQRAKVELKKIISNLL